MNLVVLSVSNAGLADLAYVSQEINCKFPGLFQVKLFYAAKTVDADEVSRINQTIAEAEFVILDLMGASREYEKLVFEACEKCQGQVVPIGGDSETSRRLLRLGSLSGKDMQGTINSAVRSSSNWLTQMMNLREKPDTGFSDKKLQDITNYIRIIKYWKNAEEENIRNLLYLIGREYGCVHELSKPNEPIVVDDTGVFDPSIPKYYKSVEEYWKATGFDEDKPIVVFLFYGHSYPNRTRGCVAALIKKITPFANVLPIAFARTTNRDLAALKDIILTQTDKRIDLVVNFLAFRLGAGPMGGNAEEAVKLLDELDVPVLHPYFMSRRDISEWQASQQGISTAEFLIQVILPELDGCIETVPIGALAERKIDSEFKIDLHELRLIEERADKVVGRIKNWLQLRRKKNSDKKVAIICYNYPPGEDNLFGGAFLDTFASVEQILVNLQAEGYYLNNMTAQELREIFTAGKLVNSGRWMGDTSTAPFIRYGSEKYYSHVQNESWVDEIKHQWGNPPGEIMSEKSNLLIPGFISGNVFIGLQPSRGIHEQPDKFYHDKSLLPHHQYIAFYQWLKEEFKADIILHVGTHGTLEFLRGKECGMSGNCLPDYLVCDIPHAYLYYAGNPAEAMIAKRRSHAVLISYQSPAFAESELYGELAVLDDLLCQREEALLLDPVRVIELEEKIWENAEKQNFFCNTFEELELELFRIRRSLIPKGLHIFNQGLTMSEAADYMKFVLRYDRSGLPSLQRLVAEDQGLDYDSLLEANQIGDLRKLDQTAIVIVDDYIRTGAISKEIFSNVKSYEICKKVLEYGYEAYKASRDCREKEGLVRVLSGRYQPVRLAGDLVRNPSVLPTGYNLYQFDPRQVPSTLAMARGAKIAQNTLEQYLKTHGCYPRSVAVILWGLETSRTQGETIGQILYYLGIKVVTKRHNFAKGYVIIPQSELARPRIDVIVNMCGFFRDMFPMLIDDLNGLFQQIAALDEANDVNYMKANTALIYQNLRSEGYDTEMAGELSAARLFGPAEAEYGTKVSKLIELKNWTDEAQLGNTYINSLQYVYSKKYRGKAVSGLLSSHLKSVELVSQVRSSHEYEVTDLDHYYEYFGGLSKSIEIAKGKKVQIYITDTTGEKIQTETVDRSISRGVRTRLFNPKWIDAMLEHSYHGVQKINDRFENVLGLAATTNKVDHWIFSTMQQIYVSDESMRKRLAKSNRWAYYSMVERLLECAQRGYWAPNKDQLKELHHVCLEIEGDIEEE